MKPQAHSYKSARVAGRAGTHYPSTLFAVVPMLFLVPTFSLSTVVAQSHGHGDGVSSHVFPAEAVERIPSPAELWSKIHNSHMGLLRAVPAMAKRNVDSYLSALEEDLNTMTRHPGGLNSNARASLVTAKQRVRQLSIGLKVAVKSNDAASAFAEVDRLSEELGKVGQLFPVDVLPKVEGLSLHLLPPRSPIEDFGLAPSMEISTEEHRPHSLSPRGLAIESKTSSSSSVGSDDRSEEECPMYSDVNGDGCPCWKRVPDKARN